MCLSIWLHFQSSSRPHTTGGHSRWVCWDRQKHAVNSVQWVWSLFVLYGQGNSFSLKRNDSVIGWLCTSLLTPSSPGAPLQPPYMDCSPPGSSVHGIFQAGILGCHFLLLLLPNPGIESVSPASAVLQGPQGRPSYILLGDYMNKACFQEIKTLQCLPAPYSAHIEGLVYHSRPSSVSSWPFQTDLSTPPCFTAQEFSASINSTHSFTQ